MTTTNAPELALEVSRVINASKEHLFNAWLDPKMLAQFMTPADGVTVPEAKTDPTPGGRYLIVMRTPDRDLPHSGTYRAIDPHDRIVFTWESEFSRDDSEVTLTFDEADGGTLVTLRHVRFLDEEKRDNHEKGWGAILEALSRLA